MKQHTKPTIRLGRPPFWRALKWRFPEYHPDGKVAVSCGRVVYANDRHIPEDFLQHEAVHLEQQGHSYTGAALWWLRYLTSTTFRLEQEVEAFHAQYRWIVANPRFWGIRHPREALPLFAEQLASPLYGSMVGIVEATNLVKYGLPRKA